MHLLILLNKLISKQNLTENRYSLQHNTMIQYHQLINNPGSQIIQDLRIYLTWSLQTTTVLMIQ